MAPAASEEFYTFASFRLYPRRRTLLREGEVVTIGGRAFDLLLMLVSNAGVVVGQRELLSFAWPSITVEEANLRVQMGLLRKILSCCDEAKRAIETVANRGYCFILSVQHSEVESVSEEREAKTVGSLPVLLNPIIGRDDAIAIVADALKEHRLVTITGPGGIGKTTVAIATADRHRACFRGNVIFVDLSTVTDGETAAQAIGDTLGVASQGNPFTALAEHLGDQQRLLILDTCEHIVEPIAALAEDLLSVCPKLRLIVTSREALRAIGEWTHRLPSLTFPEGGQKLSGSDIASYSAISLFIERVRSSMRFELREQDLPMIAEICRRLDGIPLALEFAAARAADLGLREIAGRLDDRFTILTRGRRTALPRHRTMSAALDWSYGLLSPDEQRMLCHLANLDGAFTAERAIAGGSDIGCERPPDALAGLFEKSLISVDIRNDAPIYRLFDTTRAYVASMHAD